MGGLFSIGASYLKSDEVSLFVFDQLATKEEHVQLKAELNEKVFNSTLRFGTYADSILDEGIGRVLAPYVPNFRAQHNG